MKFFKKSKIAIAVAALSLAVFSCKDYNSLNPEPQPGSAQFTKYVAVGNSLTAGYQSSALYASAQKYSFPAILAGQIATIEDFEQPLISDPGIGGRIGLGPDLSGPTPTQEQGSPINAGLNRPYDNLGIPGALLADFTGTDLPGMLYSARKSANPFFDIVLRDFGATQAEEMASLNPSFVTFWLGNNDVLGYVTSGGSTPYVPASAFQQMFAGSMQAIAQTGANAAVFNIPDVTSIPYVFLVNTQLLSDGTLAVNSQGKIALVTPQGNVPLWIQTTDPSQPGVVQDTVQMTAPVPQNGQPGDFFLLPASNYLSGAFQQGIGLSPQTPIPSQYVLDIGELTKASTLVAQYNGAISSSVNANGFALVDINSFFNQVVANGQITENGVTLRPVPGELFSFDGVHPSNQGQGVVANYLIDAINAQYNSDIPKVDISTIPLGFPVN